MVDCYKTLGINRSASQEEIKKVYRKLVKRYHPDSNPGDKQAEATFKKISEAYRILSDEDNKAEHDRNLFGFGKESSANDGDVARTRTRATGARANISPEDFTRTHRKFEDFFGFNPKTKEHNLNKNDKVKPMRTRDAFEAIFGKR